MRSNERGFLVSDPIVPFIILVILGVIAFYMFRRMQRDVRLLTAIKTDVTAWRSAEHAWHASHGSYTVSQESLGVKTMGTAHVVAARADSAGWNVVIADDSVRKEPSRCGMFEGAVSYAPGPEVTTPGEMTCWKRK